MPDHLTFIIHSVDERSSLDLLVKSLEDIQRLLRHVDYAIYRQGSRMGWAVHSLKSSAPSLTLAPRRDDRQAVAIVGDGLRLVTEGTDQPPQYFTEPALENLKKMSRLFRGEGRARALSVLVDDKKAATIEDDIADKADRVLSSGYHNLGSLQGRLDAINVHRTPTATIWDRVSGAPVRCRFPREETDRVKELLQQLVTVTGDVHYFSNGRPRSVTDVVAIEQLATPDQYLEKAGFGTIPDRRVREIGVAEWLAEVRGTRE